MNSALQTGLAAADAETAKGRKYNDLFTPATYFNQLLACKIHCPFSATACLRLCSEQMLPTVLPAWRK